MHKCKNADSRCNARISRSLTSARDAPSMPTSSVLEEGGIYHPPSYYSHGAKCKAILPGHCD
jgi:hypothetical protein